MNTNLIPLSERVHFPNPHVLASYRQESPDDVSNSPKLPLSYIEYIRLTTQETANSRFTREVSISNPLKGEKISPWNKIIDGRLISLSEKAMQVALKRILSQINWEKLNEYLQQCRRKLKEEFWQFYLRIKEKQEELKQDSP